MADFQTICWTVNLILYSLCSCFRSPKWTCRVLLTGKVVDGYLSWAWLSHVLWYLSRILCFASLLEELDSVLCLFVIAMLVAYLTSSTSRKRQMRHSGQHRQWMDIVANKNSSEISLTELGLILMMVALFQCWLINLTPNLIRNGENLLFKYRHVGWKSLKLSNLIFTILAFSTNFWPTKIDMSGNTVWQNGLFWHF